MGEIGTQPQIMTVEEVATYLRVSERTIYDWAQKGELPAGKLGNTWRFLRSEVDQWVNSRLKRASPAMGRTGTRIRDALTPERVVFLGTTSKNEALRIVADLLASAPEIADRDELLRRILHRETLMSTGLGFGVGVPHVRLGSVRNLVMAVGISRGGLADYDALDGQPVHVVCMVAAAINQHEDYLRLLAAISRKVRDESFRSALLKAEDAQAAYDVLTA